jgi:PmbA protein
LVLFFKKEQPSFLSLLGFLMLSLLSDLLAKARAAGADSADAILYVSTSVSVERRLGQIENLERSESRDLGLRVFVGNRSAIVSATSIDPARFSDLAERAVAMARVVPEDPFSALCEQMAPAEDAAVLDLLDASEPEVASLIARAETAEAAALAVPGVTNSEGGSAGYSRTDIYLVTSAGFAGSFARTGHSVSASVLAGTGTGMQRDYDYHGTLHLADLDAPELIGRSAGERAVARLNPTRPRTGKMPVIYDPRVSGSLVSHLSGAINGAAIARGTSFLKDKLGQRIFAPGISIHDDPRRPRGGRSATFDGEGVPTRARAIIEDGVLQTWFLDSRSARQLGLTSTGHASRGTGGPPGPSASNLYLAAGGQTPQTLIDDVTEGIYVTEMLGSSINQMTGDYSRGAAGFMIRNGAFAEPVAEITVAGNLNEMFANLTPANDLRFRRGTDAPTVRVDGMMVAGA